MAAAYNRETTSRNLFNRLSQWNELTPAHGNNYVRLKNVLKDALSLKLTSVQELKDVGFTPDQISRAVRGFQTGANDEARDTIIWRLQKRIGLPVVEVSYMTLVDNKPTALAA